LHWPPLQWPGGGWSWQAAAAVSGAGAALERADQALGTALQGLASAGDVDWVSPAASRYRAVLADGADRLRAARSRLDDAVAATTRHDAAVDLARTARRHDLAAQVFGACLGAAGGGLVDGPAGAAR
jgi:hypothetical protein